MAVKIRLTRMGAKKAPCYRIVAIDSKKSRDGKYIEQIGFYDPISEPVTIKIDAEKANKWLKVGAIPTDTVKSLFVMQGIMAKTEYKKVEVKEAPAAEPKKDEE